MWPSICNCIPSIWLFKFYWVPLVNTIWASRSVKKFYRTPANLYLYLKFWFPLMTLERVEFRLIHRHEVRDSLNHRTHVRPLIVDPISSPEDRRWIISSLVRLSRVLNNYMSIVAEYFTNRINFDTRNSRVDVDSLSVDQRTLRYYIYRPKKIGKFGTMLLWPYFPAY